MNCPNNCEALTQLVFTTATDREFLEDVMSVLPERRGIEDIMVVDKNEDPTVRIDINQDDYETQDYFKYRNEYEEMDAVEVEDLGVGTAELVFTGKLLKRVNRCDECGEVTTEEGEHLPDAELAETSHYPWIWAGTI